MKKVSLIIPCYNEEQALPIFAGELDKVRQELRQYDFEVLMVNDGSSDKTLETMKKISEHRQRQPAELHRVRTNDLFHRIPQQFKPHKGDHHSNDQ